MSHPKQLQAQSSSLSVLRNKEAVASVVLDAMQDAEATTTYPQPSEKCSLSSASLWHGDVETMLELDVLPHKGHDLHTNARMQILPGPLGLPPGTPVLSASGATDKASMLRQALANVKEDTAKMTVPTITRDQSTKAHPPAYATPSDLLSPDLSGSDEGSISSTCAAFRTFGHVADSEHDLSSSAHISRCGRRERGGGAERRLKEEPSPLSPPPLGFARAHEVTKSERKKTERKKELQKKTAGREEKGRAYDPPLLMLLLLRLDEELASARLVLPAGAGNERATPASSCVRIRLPSLCWLRENESKRFFSLVYPTPASPSVELLASSRCIQQSQRPSVRARLLIRWIRARPAGWMPRTSIVREQWSVM
ncbi:hypothetical protein HPB50_004214 [Hyalomma asiaticum]|uniref:Uncharacterized protein n=1 Tax=Hyalomma asiaticum TaxID=266040 RepID=A0ACB7SSK6_HYAAI|nr:hypothetical protein HPB50_004214 [Hyalomma asiaticum]